MSINHSMVWARVVRVVGGSIAVGFLTDNGPCCCSASGFAQSGVAPRLDLVRLGSSCPIPHSIPVHRMLFVCCSLPASEPLSDIGEAFGSFGCVGSVGPDRPGPAG